MSDTSVPLGAVGVMFPISVESQDGLFQAGIHSLFANPLVVLISGNDLKKLSRALDFYKRKAVPTAEQSRIPSSCLTHSR